MTSLSSLSKYGPSFQIKVISGLLTHKPFLQNIYDVLDVNSFDNPAHKWIIENILKYYYKYHTHPSMDVLHIEIKKLENEVLKISIIDQLKEAYRVPEEELEYVENEFLTFCKNQQLKQALLTSVDLLNAGSYDDIRKIIDGALRSGQDRNIGHEYEKDIETRYRDDNRKPIPYPWEPLNNITQGGYGGGELILIFGPPKSGKSWTVIDMAAYAALIGYNVVYYTLELSEEYVGRRIDAFLSKINLEDLKHHRPEVEAAIASMKGRLIIKELTAGKATITDVEKHQSQLKHTEDFNTEAIFIDYLDLMRNRNKNRKEKIDDIDDIYVDARALAKTLNIPIVSPSQINRAGANDSIIQQDKIAGSYSKFFHADFALSLSRKLEDKEEGTGRFHVMGSRVGPDGLTFYATINTSNGEIVISETPFTNSHSEENKKSANSSGEVSSVEKELLRKKFFEMETEG